MENLLSLDSCNNQLLEIGLGELWKRGEISAIVDWWNAIVDKHVTEVLNQKIASTTWMGQNYFEFPLARNRWKCMENRAKGYAWNGE